MGYHESMFQEQDVHLPLFNGLLKEQIDQIKTIFRTCKFPQGQTIFEQGQNANYFYILLAGQVEIRYKPYDVPSLMVTHIHSGDVFGWSSILGHTKYTSSAVSLCECEVIYISHDDMRCLIKSSPEMGDILIDRMASGIAQHLKSTHSKVLTLIKKGL